MRFKSSCKIRHHLAHSILCWLLRGSPSRVNIARCARKRSLKVRDVHGYSVSEGVSTSDADTDLESTRKRHYYYCRSRRPDTNASRRRSCTACVRAKTRCTGLVNSSLKICIRCNERGTKCDYDTASRPDLVSGQDYISRRSSRDTGIQRSTTSSIVNGGFDLTEDWPVSMHVQKYQDLPSTFDTLLDNNWDANLGDLDTLDLENQVTVGNQAIDPVPSTMSTLSDTLVTGISSLEPKTFQFSSPYPFNFRTVAKPSHIPLVSLATRILRSYPFMILQDGALPPFLSPQMYAWARAGTGPQQQVSFLHLISIYSPSPGS